MCVDRRRPEQSVLSVRYDRYGSAPKAERNVTFEPYSGQSSGEPSRQRTPRPYVRSGFFRIILIEPYLIVKGNRLGEGRFCVERKKTQRFGSLMIVKFLLINRLNNVFILVPNIYVITRLMRD